MFSDSSQKIRFCSNVNVMLKLNVESNIHAPVLLNLSKLSQKRDKLLGKTYISSLFQISTTPLINSIKHERS